MILHTKLLTTAPTAAEPFRVGGPFAEFEVIFAGGASVRVVIPFAHAADRETIDKMRTALADAAGELERMAS